MALDTYHYYLLFIPHMLFSLSLHEASHAYAAYWAGDDTAALQGRISLNPLRHLDPWGILAFVIIKLGWAKPVPVNPARFRHPRRDDVLVSLAGPGSNVILALIFSLLLRGSWRALQGMGEPGLMVLFFLAIGAQLNLALALFNFLPIPPLDGSHLLAGILPRGPALAYRRIMPYGMFLLLGLILLGNFTGFNVFGVLIGIPMWLGLRSAMGPELFSFVMHGASYL